MKTRLRLLYFSILVCCIFGFSNRTYAQLNYSEDFEIDEGGWSDDDFFAFYFFPCAGENALTAEMYSDPDFEDFYAPVTISSSLGTSNGLQATLTYSYSLIDWNTFEGVTNSPDWGEFTIEYSSSGSGPWTNLQTINPSNHVESDDCVVKTVTFTPPVGPVYLRITGTPNGSELIDVLINIDNISVVQAMEACTGTPAASSAVADQALLCNGSNVNLSLSPAYTASGLIYQWQSSPDGISYTNVPTGGTSGTYSTSQAASMWYRANISCGAGTPVTSTPVHVINSGMPCLCDVVFTDDIEPITHVEFAGIDNTSAAAVNGTPGVQNFTNLSPAQVSPGETYEITLEGNTNDPDGDGYETYFTVFLDWNRDGDFEDDGEKYDIDYIVFSDGEDGVQATGNIDVPADAMPGLTYMRVFKLFNVFPDAACGDEFGYGQVEDYLVNVAAPSTDTPDWVNLQWPATISFPAGGSDIVYARAYEPGLTNAAGQGAGITAWIGISPAGSNTNPNTWTTWVPATYNAAATVIENDEYMATIGAGLTAGTYYYASRFQLNGGPYTYGGYTPTGGGYWDGTTNVSGVLTVTCATAAPVATPAQTLCEGSTVANLVATGTTIKWYSAATGGTALAGTTALVNGSVYYASITPAGGCESVTRTMVTVTISSVATPIVTVVQPTCATPTGTIVITSPVGAGYTYDANGTGFQAAATFTNLVSGTYTITAKNALGCTASVPVIINNAPVIPAAPVVAIVQPTCSVPVGTITVTSPVGAGLTYNIDGSAFQASTVFNDVMPGTHSVSVQNAEGCIAFTSGLVVNTVPASPDAPTGDATQEIEVATANDATIEDIEVTATGTVKWYASEEDAEAGEDALEEGTVITNGTYYTTQTIDGCESTPFAVIVDVTLGNGEFNATSFRYHPNPVKDMLTLSYDKNISGIEVYNIVGQKVIIKSVNQNEVQLDMSQLAAGTYLVKVMSDTASKTVKVVKQ